MTRLHGVGVLLAMAWACGQQSGAGPASASADPPATGPAADGGTPSPDPLPAGRAVDPYKELAVVDPSVVEDARASSRSDGPWSFRFVIEQLSPQPAQAVEAWLRSLRATSIDGVAVQDRSGVEDLLAAWPRSAGGSLDLSRAPFRLLAIVNRMDLTTSPNGEGRLVFGLLDSSGNPDRMTVGFEFALPGVSRQEWARRWHALGDQPFGEGYNAALETLTRSFVSAQALSQVRTNEARFGPDWEQRQWVLEGASLRPVLTPRTPGQSLNGSSQLAQWLRDNAAAVRSGSFDLPRAMLGGAARETEAWSFRDHPEIDEPLRHAFAAATCNGCHSSETDSARGFFHVDPFAPAGPRRLSGFMRDSQLPQRAKNLASLLQGGPVVLPALPPLPQRSATPAYDMVLVPAAGDTSPVALDASGRVLGNSPRGPWIWDGRLLYATADASLHATGFNANGTVVGYQGSGNDSRAWSYSGMGMKPLGGFGGLSLANAVNLNGHIAGDSVTGVGDYHGFLWSPDTFAMKDIGTLGGSETMTAAINTGGQITGESQAADGTRHVFVADSRGMRDLGTLGGDFAFGQAINDKGQVAGMSETVPGDRKIHAFFYDGTMHDLGALPGLPWTSAPGLNNAGVVVGNVYNKPDDGSSNYDTYAYVWTAKDGMRNLNDLVPQSAVKLRTVLGINDAGQILCSDGQVGAATAHAYLLTPK